MNSKHTLFDHHLLLALQKLGGGGFKECKEYLGKLPSFLKRFNGYFRDGVEAQESVHLPEEYLTTNFLRRGSKILESPSPNNPRLNRFSPGNIFDIFRAESEKAMVVNDIWHVIVENTSTSFWGKDAKNMLPYRSHHLSPLECYYVMMSETLQDAGLMFESVVCLRHIVNITEANPSILFEFLLAAIKEQGSSHTSGEFTDVFYKEPLRGSSAKDDLDYLRAIHGTSPILTDEYDEPNSQGEGSYVHRNELEFRYAIVSEKIKESQGDPVLRLDSGMIALQLAQYQLGENVSELLNLAETSLSDAIALVEFGDDPEKSSPNSVEH